MLSFLVVGRGLLAVGAAALFAAAAKALRGLYTYKYQVPGLMVRLSGSALVSVVKYVVRGRKPRFPEWTFASELEQAALQHFGMRTIPEKVSPRRGGMPHRFIVISETFRRSTSRPLSLTTSCLTPRRCTTRLRRLVSRPGHSRSSATCPMRSPRHRDRTGRRPPRASTK
jgi:hypothetical protein